MSAGEAPRQRSTSLARSGLVVTRGMALPLGATVMRDGVNFAVFSRHATRLTLVLFPPGGGEPIAEFLLDPRFNRTGDVWHVFVHGLDPGVEYAYRADRVPNLAPHLHRYDRLKLLVDPYVRALAVAPQADGDRSQFRGIVVGDDFDWGDDQPLDHHLADSVIYEVHLRGFTRHASSGVPAPGTYAGLVDKIPYLQELGVTAVELMPITEFDSNDNPHTNPLTGERLRDFWGYDPIAFFAPKAGYARRREAGHAVIEFKEMVRAMHAANIEVILDMVFNHTAEGDERGPTQSFRGLDNAVYYILDPLRGTYFNYSGCGNTLNCNHPVVRDLILDCLRYWVTEMHVDGFRFDLASILGRGQDGSVLANPPLLERIAADPVLANTKLIAEAWDAAGLYQVGTFPNWGRWAEWNGRFRDDVRRFVKGDRGMVPVLATRLAGSADLYQSSGRQPYHSINFVTSHDGFTLADLVAYNDKHNEANGEGNADGANDNHSWNCGAEGPTGDAAILGMRRRQMKNLAALLLLSRGVPMLLAGDEVGRTQQGNNNAYCQDNDIGWLDWRLLVANADLFRFVKHLVNFRKAHPALRSRTFNGQHADGSPDVVWHGIKPYDVDWSDASHFLVMHLRGGGLDDDILVVANAHWEGASLQLPRLAPGKRWHRFLDTALGPPAEITEPGAEAPVAERTYAIGPRSTAVFVGR